jgi:hypothetical protein
MAKRIDLKGLRWRRSRICTAQSKGESAKNLGNGLNIKWKKGKRCNSIKS